MRKKLVFGLLAVLALVQISFSLAIIVKRELVLKNGTPFRFKTVPIDPADPFRGRYIALRIKDNKVSRPKNIYLIRGKKVYAEIMVDKNGYAKISQITKQKPTKPDFLKAKISHLTTNEVTLDLPFNRYYMKEKIAPQAEKIYREHAESMQEDTYVIVRVKNGLGVIEGLYIGDQRIENLLKK